MLTRKPRIGEPLTYQSADGPKQYKVVGFHSGSDNILRILPVDGGEETLIIWRFRNGLNKLLAEVRS